MGELHLQLDDVEKLLRYAQSDVSKHHTLDDALDKAKARSKSEEWKAKGEYREDYRCEKKDEAKEAA